jgi:hypothetical protein
VTGIEGNLVMSYKHYALLSALVVAFLPGMVGKAIGSAEPNMIEQTLAAIQDCVADSSTPWPDAWQSEYVDTIRHVIASHQDISEYATRLEILQNGFRPYWEGLKKSKDRSLFEVRCAEIQWYTEHLMSTELPRDDEKQKLRDQYKELWEHAACSLLTQFPFLDPNTVQKAKENHLCERYSQIEAPLLPIFLRPFSEDQVDKIKQNWHNLRYARVDLLRQLAGDSAKSMENKDTQSLGAHSQYLLTQSSLNQLLTNIWPIIFYPPDYYRNSLVNHINAQRNRHQSRSEAFRQERRLEREHSRQILQTEHISFLLAALLESPQCFQESSSFREQKETIYEQQDNIAKGGDAYEIGNVSTKK